MTEAQFNCMLLYVFATIICIVWHFLVPRMTNVNKTDFHTFLIGFWFFYGINAIYTGLLGWNWTPASCLEWWLDLITAAGVMFSIVFLHRRTKGFRKSKNEKVKA